MGIDNPDSPRQEFSLEMSLLPNTLGQNIHTTRKQEGQRALKLLDWPYTDSNTIETEALGRPYFMDRHAGFNAPSPNRPTGGETSILTINALSNLVPYRIGYICYVSFYKFPNYYVRFIFQNVIFFRFIKPFPIIFSR